MAIDPARIRTWNPLIRSQMPYPLGHRAVTEVGCDILNFIATDLHIKKRRKKKNRPCQDSNLESPDP